jgi:hypothetical protein
MLRITVSSSAAMHGVMTAGLHEESRRSVMCSSARCMVRDHAGCSGDASRDCHLSGGLGGSPRTRPQKPQQRVIQELHRQRTYK